MKAKIISKNFYAPQLEEGEIVTIVPGMETDAEGIWNVPAGKLFLCKKGDGKGHPLRYGDEERRRRPHGKMSLARRQTDRKTERTLI